MSVASIDKGGTVAYHLGLAAGLALSLGLAGCSTQNPSLFFAQAHTLGVDVAGSTTEQSAHLTLGYKDLAVAVVPTTATGRNGEVVPLIGTAGGRDSQNALSVLGQFNASAASATPSVNLGTFFATGLAADKLADGFSDQLSRK
jgi:hypothetical protein